MSLSNFYILTSPIQTGKTSALISWVKNQSNIAGFVTPDINGLRKMVDLSNNMMYDFQLDKASPDSIQIGKFNFDQKVFIKAKNILSKIVVKQIKWVVIDEIGPLEMNNKGLEPELSEFVNKMKLQNDTKILLVVRESLIDSFIEKYALQEANIVSLAEFKTW